MSKIKTINIEKLKQTLNKFDISQTPLKHGNPTSSVFDFNFSTDVT